MKDIFSESSALVSASDNQFFKINKNLKLDHLSMIWWVHRLHFSSSNLSLQSGHNYADFGSAIISDLNGIA